MKDREERGFDLFDLGVLDGPRERSFDTIVDLVVEAIACPISLLTIVDDLNDRQHFKAEVGLPEPWASRGETPLSHSFCRIVRDTNRMLIIRDSRLDMRVAKNRAIADLDVISYIGAPIYCPANDAVGALCAIDTEPRDWTERDQLVLTQFAHLATELIMLRASLETIKIIKRSIDNRSV